MRLAGEDSQAMHRVGSVLVTAATIPLALGLLEAFTS